jgi:D-aminoacyl-tRNA deacylase
MTVLIIASTKDPASTNIKRKLLEQSSWDEIATCYNNPVYQQTMKDNVVVVTISDNKIRHENLTQEIKQNLGITPKQAIFISRHRSKTGEPTLTTHPIGNYGPANFGGKPRTLSLSSPRLMTCFLRIIKKNADEAGLYHHVCFEVTHHGPYMDIPVFFVEVGSTEEEWNNQESAAVVAQSLLDLLELYHYEEEHPEEPVLIGIGGGHYAPRFTDVALEKKVAFGHMIPTYHIRAGNIDNETFNKALQATPQVEGVYFHRKALKKSLMSEYRQWFEDHDVPVVSSKELPSL